tara:strand:+ start:117 stop:320 length:204 start_codon:yes stop_codon:yes gene_type:complete
MKVTVQKILSLNENFQQHKGSILFFMSEETKAKVRIFLPFSWLIPAIISFAIINTHQLSAGLPPLSI